MFINVMFFRILIIPKSAMHTKIGVLGLYSFDLKDSLRMVPSRRNMHGINTCHQLYFIECISWLAGTLYH